MISQVVFASTFPVLWELEINKEYFSKMTVSTCKRHGSSYIILNRNMMSIQILFAEYNVPCDIFLIFNNGDINQRTQCFRMEKYSLDSRRDQKPLLLLPDILRSYVDISTLDWRKSILHTFDVNFILWLVRNNHTTAKKNRIAWNRSEVFALPHHNKPVRKLLLLLSA